MRANAIALNPKAHELQGVKTSDPMFDRMEKTQEKIAPHFEKLANPPQEAAALMIPQDIQEKALNIVNQIRVTQGEEPHTPQNAIRRLHAILSRVSAAVEKYIFAKKDHDHLKKQEIMGKVDDIASWTRGQGWAYTVSGFGSPLLQITGNLIGGQLGDLVKGLSQLTPHGAQALDKFIESAKQPDEFNKSLYIQMASSDKQTLESLKRLPEQVQQLIKQLIQLDDQAVRATGQR